RDDEERAARRHRLLDLAGQEGGAELELGVLRHVVEERGGRVDHRHALVQEVGVGHLPGVVVLAGGRFIVLSLLTRSTQNWSASPPLSRNAAFLPSGVRSVPPASW